MADFGKNNDHARVLTDWPPPERRHARVHQDLRDGVLCSRAFLALISRREMPYEVRRMKAGDELQCVRDALHDVCR